MCKDPQHHAQRFGPKFGKILGYVALVLAGGFMSFCPECWSSRIARWAA